MSYVVDRGAVGDDGPDGGIVCSLSPAGGAVGGVELRPVPPPSGRQKASSRVPARATSSRLPGRCAGS